jgi:hypothetical protein
MPTMYLKDVTDCTSEEVREDVTNPCGILLLDPGPAERGVAEDVTEPGVLMAIRLCWFRAKDVTETHKIWRFLSL